jgi:hypothetical protein
MSIRAGFGKLVASDERRDAMEACADGVISLIERYASGFSSKVLARSVTSPADLER